MGGYRPGCGHHPYGQFDPVVPATLPCVILSRTLCPFPFCLVTGRRRFLLFFASFPCSFIDGHQVGYSGWVVRNSSYGMFNVMIVMG